MDTIEQTQDAGWRGTVAKASLALSIFTVLWFIIAALGTKLGLWNWQVGLGLMTINWGLKLVALAFGVSVVALGISLVKAPRKRAFMLALAAFLIALLLGGRILFGFIGGATRLPPIHDVQTDWSNPIMPSDALLAVRAETEAMNPVEAAPIVPEYAEDRWPGTPGRLVSELQEEAEFDPTQQDDRADAPYPKLDSYITQAPSEAAFEAILTLVKERGWVIVASDETAGRIEATETSFWFDFKDDIMIRIQPTEEGGSRIDVRSTSRVGLSDLGANAKRVRNLLDDIEIALR
ncbi:DUF1499 domain-containing protein [Hyphomonas sp. UBA5107]|uniref:DUF1499 domain-containing protein n=2 Tax=unclassified Hyphomonas TaxID=2630699 RepID=UPI0025BE6266|nr:DUF1499 domain-containing protein [Hyphomonas sp. UBA5107]|tara:strand:+ start:724 stop:1599 length:876 start_codon:yes stop_codon:yes gene_type:complete